MWKLSRTIFQLCSGIAACANLTTFNAMAQAYPTKPIHIYVGFTAGSGADAVARLVAPKLSKNLSQPVVIENRVGASGTIATERVAASPPDGYVLLLVTAAEAAQPALRAKLPYDLQRDFAPVSLLAVAPLLLVVNSVVPAHNVKELIRLARLRPGKLSYGSSGVGSATHLAGVLFRLMAKVDIVHVAYKGGAENTIATASGEVDMSFPGISAVQPLLATGKLRALAVSSATRSSLMPSIPTIDESGLRGYNFSSWQGILAPAGVRKEIITRLNVVIGKIMNTAEMEHALIKQGFDPHTNTPEQFAEFIRKQIALNGKLIQITGGKVE